MRAKIETLIDKLDTSSDKIAERAIQSLAEIGKPAIPRLISALADSRMTVRLHAVRGLARLEHRPASRAISKLLSDASGGIRVNAIDALARLGDRSVGRKLLRALKDQQWYVRQHACRACAALRGAVPKSSD